MEDEKILKIPNDEEEISQFLKEMKKSQKKLNDYCKYLQGKISICQYNVFSHTYHNKINIAKNINNIDKSKSFHSVCFDWKTTLKSQLVQIFYIPNNLYPKNIKCATTLEEIADTILFNESLFKSCIKKAVTQLGKDFLEEKILLDIKNPTNDFITVEGILNESVTDITQLEIRKGIPFPYYHKTYNGNLPYVLDKYI